MKVKELIKKLEELDQELQVSIEGCDCIGDADDVYEDHGIFGSERYALITRVD